MSSRTSSPTMSDQPVAPKALRLTLPTSRTVRWLRSPGSLSFCRQIWAASVIGWVTPRIVTLPSTVAPSPAWRTEVEAKVISGKALASSTFGPFIAWAAKGKLASAF
jgi:hypothetical protein